MKKGISIWAFPSKMSLDECITEAVRAGFDGIELVMGRQGVSMEVDKDGLKRTRDKLWSSGLELYSVASGEYFSISLTADDPEQREKAKKLVRDQLDTAAILGCDSILVVPGVVSIPWNKAAGKVPYDIAYERSLEALRELAPYAERSGVCIAIENVWNRFLVSPFDMRGIIDEVNSPFVKAYFDVGNVLAFGHPEQWIRILGKRIGKVHIKDYKISVGSADGFVDLLTGDVNFPEVMDALREVGYDGWITAEVFPHKHYPLTSIDSISSAMDAILGRGRYTPENAK